MSYYFYFGNDGVLRNDDAVESDLHRERIDFYHKRFQFTRLTLQFFGFWHKPDAGLLSRYVYPLLVNLLILSIFIMECTFFIMACSLQGEGAPHELILELFVRVTMSCSYWLMHCLTIQFFKSRHMEEQMLDVDLGKQGSAPLGRFTRRLNTILVVCHLFAILVTGVSIKTGILDHFPVTWSSENASSIGNLNGVIYASNFVGEPTNLFWIPVSLTLTWIMYIFYESSKFRLSKIVDDFLQWEASPEDAIYHHLVYYSSSIRNSSSKITALFFTHNILMIILIPQFMYLCVLVGRQKTIGEFIAFIIYFLVIFASWILPLVFAEGIRSNELTFKNEINKFSEKYITRRCEEPTRDITKKTFGKRKNIEKLVLYLKERKTGLVIWGFALQLRLSTWSFYVGILLFVFRVFHA